MRGPDPSLTLIASPYDSGHFDTRMGAGPLSLLRAGVVESLKADGHAVSTVVLEPTSSWRSELRTAFELQAGIAAEARRAREGGAFPLVLAGNCNASIGALAALTGSGARIGLLWLDAHADFNDPDHDAIGFLDGQGLAIAVGRCWRAAASRVHGFEPVLEDDVLLIGVRDLDDAQWRVLRRSKLGVLEPDAARDVDQLTAALNRLAERVDVIHLHVDLDVYDPTIAPANDYAADGGLSAEEVDRVVALAADRMPLASATLASYDPSCDPAGELSNVARDLVRHIARLAGAVDPFTG